MGEHAWLTVGHEKSEFELLLEPNVHPAAKSYQKAIYKDGIPSTKFYVDDLDVEFERLTSLGVCFKSEPNIDNNVTLEQKLDKWPAIAAVPPIYFSSNKSLGIGYNFHRIMEYCR